MGRGKTSSDSLFELIKSLSRTEKRYFKLYISRHSLGQKGINEKLFNAISTQNIYEETALINRFRNENFAKNFSVAKTRLYNNILQSLQFFHSRKSIDNTLNQYLNEIEILYKKSLYDHCWKILRKAEKLSVESDKNISQLAFFKWKIKLTEAAKYQTKNSAGIENEFIKAKELVNELTEENEIIAFKTNFFQELYAGKVTKANTKIAQQIKALGTINKYGSKKSKLTYCQIKAAWYFALNQQKKAINYAEKSLVFISDDEIETKIASLGNIVYSSISSKEYAKAELYLSQLKVLRSNNYSSLSDAQQARLFENISSLDLYLNLSQGKIEAAYNLMNETAEELSQYNGQISSLNRASFYFNFSQISLIKGEYKNALSWINQLINYPKIDKNERIFSQGLLLSLIIHLELDNYSYILSKLKSIERYLSMRNRLHDFEIIFLKHMKLLAKNRIEDQHELYLNWRMEILKSGIEKQHTLLTSFNLINWLTSKSKNVTMQELMN